MLKTAIGGFPQEVTFSKRSTFSGPKAFPEGNLKGHLVEGVQSEQPRVKHMELARRMVGHLQPLKLSAALSGSHFSRFGDKILPKALLQSLRQLWDCTSTCLFGIELDGKQRENLDSDLIKDDYANTSNQAFFSSISLSALFCNM